MIDLSNVLMVVVGGVKAPIPVACVWRESPGLGAHSGAQ